MITYKELRNFQRLERENSDLQDLGLTFVSDVLDYLNEKREALKSSKEKDSIFSKDAQTEIRNELRNAIVVIQDIYERRERKILGQAVLTIKTDSSIQDTTKMLDFEKKMYKEVVELLRRYREQFFGQKKKSVHERPVDELKPVSVQPLPEEPDEPAEPGLLPAERPALAQSEPETLEPPRPPEHVEPVTEKPAEDKPGPISEQPTKGLQTIRITQEMPQFLWEDGKTYGPFRKEDVVHIDAKLSSMLIERGNADEL